MKAGVEIARAVNGWIVECWSNVGRGSDTYVVHDFDDIRPIVDAFLEKVEVTQTEASPAASEA